MLCRNTKYLFFRSSFPKKFLQPFHSSSAFQILSICGERMVQKSSKLIASSLVKPCCWQIDSTRSSIWALSRLLLAISSRELQIILNIHMSELIINSFIRLLGKYLLRIDIAMIQNIPYSSIIYNTILKTSTKCSG